MTKFPQIWSHWLEEDNPYPSPFTRSPPSPRSGSMTRSIRYLAVVRHRFESIGHVLIERDVGRRRRHDVVMERLISFQDVRRDAYMTQDIMTLDVTDDARRHIRSKTAQMTHFLTRTWPKTWRDPQDLTRTLRKTTQTMQDVTDFQSVFICPNLHNPLFLFKT